MRALTASRIFVSSALMVCCLTLASCSTPKTPRSQEDSDAIQLLSFCQPHLLYLLASPHSRLYVEVDAVEGCIPSEASLHKLRDFLATYCTKPGGIEIIRSDVIPVAVARGISPRALAHKFLDGPPDNTAASPPAFMYLLYYDGALSDNPPVAETGPPSVTTSPRPRARTMHPHADLLPYPVILMNTRYGVKWCRDETLLHEAGHLTGLAFRPAYASDGHCLGSTCLMNRRLRMSLLLLGWQKQLCQRCARQLVESSRQPPPSGQHFVGPVLVRSAAGYHVLALPYSVKLIVGDLAEQDSRDFAAAERTETPSSGSDDGELRLHVLVKEELVREPAKIREILSRAKADPYEPVRTIASKLESEGKNAAAQ